MLKVDLPEPITTLIRARLHYVEYTFMTQVINQVFFPMPEDSNRNCMMIECDLMHLTGIFIGRCIGRKTMGPFFISLQNYVTLIKLEWAVQ